MTVHDDLYTLTQDDAHRIAMYGPLAAAEAADTNGTQPDSWQPINLATLPDTPPIKPTLGGVGIVYPGKRHVFSGPPESAKTLAAYCVGINTIRAGGTIILIDFEMGSYDARDRLTELGATPQEIAAVHYLEPSEPATDPRIQRLVQLQPHLVIIDAAAGAYDLQGLDDNKRGDVEKLARLYVRSFWRANIASIFIDHVVKNTETRGKYAIGSERKLGGTDVHLGFETITPIQRGSTGLYKVVTHKDRGGYLQRGHLANLELASDTSHQISWQFKPAEHAAPDAPFRPTTLMERISGWLRLQQEPVSRKRVEDGVKGHNAKAKRTALDVLIAEGFVTETAGPRNAKLVQNVRPYKADDPACNPQTGLTSSTSSHLVPPRPDEDNTTSSSLVPPYGGQTRLSDELDTTTSSNSSWLDDLTYWDASDLRDLDIPTDPEETE